MEKEMIEFFIYYVMSIADEQSEDFSLDGLVKYMEIACEIIKNEGIISWNKHLDIFKSSIDIDEHITINNDNKETKGVYNFKYSHPVLKLRDALSNLSGSQYIDTINTVKKKIIKYSQISTVNFDSLFLICSDNDVKKLTYEILIRDYSNEKLVQEILATILEENNKENLDDDQKILLLYKEYAMRLYYEIGMEQDCKLATKICSKFADYDNDAKYLLACSYERGKGVNKNLAEAYNLYSSLMKDGDFRGKYGVAKMLYYGNGVEKDKEKAFEIFSKIRNTVPYDMNCFVNEFLGRMYFLGDGTLRDSEKGFSLLESAWNSGFVNLNYGYIKKVLKEYYDID